MNRRAFLVSAASLSAGCIGVSSQSSTTKSTQTAGPTQTTTQPDGSPSTTTAPHLEESRTLSITNLSQGNLGLGGLSAAATLPTNTVTEQHPARIQLTISAPTETNISYRVCRPGNIHFAERTNSSNELVLREGDLSNGAPDCWRITTPLDWGQPCQTKSATITPSSPFTRTYIVWNHPENPSCFPTGTYHVEDSVTEDETTYAWSFDLRVSK